MNTSHKGRPTTKASRELHEEHARMKRQLDRVLQASGHTQRRKVPHFVRVELEVLEANIAALERKYDFTPDEQRLVYDPTEGEET